MFKGRKRPHRPNKEALPVMRKSKDFKHRESIYEKYSFIWIFTFFVFFMFIFLIYIPGIVIEKISDAHEEAYEAKKPVPVFETYPEVIRQAARADLEKNLLKANLTDANVAVLNRKILPLGLAVDNHSNVRVLSKEEWEEAKLADKEAFDLHSRNMLEIAAYEYEKLRKEHLNFLKDDAVVSGKSEVKTDAPEVEDNSNGTVAEEEEEEIVQDNLEAFYEATNKLQQRQLSKTQMRALQRQKLLMRYLLNSMQNSLKVVHSQNGHVTQGSRYLQEQIDYYSR